MTAPYVPLGLAALGIALRGSGFARKGLIVPGEQRVAGAVFASSSVLRPFFFGAVAGAIATGRVPGDGNGVHGHEKASTGGQFVVATGGQVEVPVLR